MLNTNYQRNKNRHFRNTNIEANPEQSSQINTDYSWLQYAKVNLALVTTLLGTMFLGTATALPSLEKSNSESDTTDTGLDNSHSLVNLQEAILFADNNIPIQPRHAKRVVGSEFQINTDITSTQNNPSIAALSSGDFVVVWESEDQDGSSNGIYAQRFSSTGVPQGSEFQINTYTAAAQAFHSVAALNSSDFVVVWSSDGQDSSDYGVYGQRYLSTGVALGSEFQVNTYTALNQRRPSVAALSSGDFVVVWNSDGQDSSDYGVYGQRYLSTGVALGSEFQVNTYTALNQRRPSVAALSSGDFVVVWNSDGQDGDSWGIYGQRFSNLGVAQGSEFQINTYTTSWQAYPSVAALTTGDFVVVWYSYGQDGVYGQRFSNLGVAQGSEFQINTYTPTSWQAYPSVAALTTGDFVVVWASDGQDSDGYGIYGQRFSSTGVLQGSEFQINTYTTTNQRAASVAVLSTGDFVVVWESNGQDGDSYGIYGRIYFKPVLVNNRLTINEGERIVLSTQELNAKDNDNNNSDLIFTISNLQNGQFERVSNPGVAIASFSQQDIIDGAIQFIHNGSDNAPTYDISVSVSMLSEGPTSANITFSNNVNDAPKIVNHLLILLENETLVITSDAINVFDSDNTNIKLTFNIANSNNGYFRTAAIDTPITQFTMQQILDNDIRFVSDGVGLPSYNVDVNDGLATSNTELANIIYITQNQLVTKPGDTFVLDSNQLAIQTQLAPTAVEILLSNVLYGRFEKIFNTGVPISSFTLAEFNAGVIQFIHGETENAPQYTMHFRNIAANYSSTRGIPGNTILNHPPTIINPTGTLNWQLKKRSSYPLPNTLFSDPDGDVLQLSVRTLNDASLPPWVQFDNATNTLTGTPATSGLYDFKTIARDPYDEMAEDRFSIDIKASNEGTNLLPVAFAVVGGTALIGGCIGAGILYFKKIQDRKTRQQHKFAQLIRHHLKLQNVDNFKSEDGQRFVQVVQDLSNLLSDEQGINIENMDENRLDGLASSIAASAKNKITPNTTKFFNKSKISITDFADNIEGIARDNRLDDISYAEVSDDVSISMHTR